MKPPKDNPRKGVDQEKNQPNHAAGTDEKKSQMCPRCRLVPLRTDQLLKQYCLRCGYRAPGVFT